MLTTPITDTEISAAEDRSKNLWEAQARQKAAFNEGMIRDFEVVHGSLPPESFLRLWDGVSGNFDAETGYEFRLLFTGGSFFRLVAVLEAVQGDGVLPLQNRSELWHLVREVREKSDNSRGAEWRPIYEFLAAVQPIRLSLMLRDARHYLD